MELFCGGRRTDEICRRSSERHQIDRMQLEPELAQDDARDIQELLDQFLLCGCTLLDAVGSDRHRVAVGIPGAENRRPTENGGQRRFELVGQGGEKLILGAIGALQLGNRFAQFFLCRLTSRKQRAGQGGRHHENRHPEDVVPAQIDLICPSDLREGDGGGRKKGGEQTGPQAAHRRRHQHRQNVKRREVGGAQRPSSSVSRRASSTHANATA